MKDYKAVFSKLEDSLRQHSGLSDAEFRSRFEKFKHFENRLLSDNDYYRIMVDVTFYSGFRAAVVSGKLDLIHQYFPDFETVAKYDEWKVSQILGDNNMIRNVRKVEACIANARTFKRIVSEYGSFGAYVKSFEPTQSFENLMLLKEELEHKFAYLGRITAYHFLTDIGMPVLKPDRVVCRIFYRLGLIESKKQLLEAVIQGRKLSQATSLPIRYVDIVLVTYGQVGANDYFGIKNGICLEKNPKCNICGVKEYCDYYADNYRTVE